MPVSPECCDCLISRIVHTCALVGRSAEADLVASACAARLADFATCPYRSLRSPRRSIASQQGCSASGTRTPGEGQSTEVVRAACRVVRPRLQNFRDFVIASIIGNTFDHGVKGHEIADDFLAFFEAEYAWGLAIDDCDRIERLLGHVVYITDNCGEIVLDRLLIEHLVGRGARVTIAVRDGPILNDATLEDALGARARPARRRPDHDRGGSEIGVSWTVLPSALVEAIAGADLIIAKGMANYESLSEWDDLPPVAYLLAAKCRPIAARLGVRVGEKVAMLRSSKKGLLDDIDPQPPLLWSLGLRYPVLDVCRDLDSIRRHGGRLGGAVLVAQDLGRPDASHDRHDADAALELALDPRSPDHVCMGVELVGQARSRSPRPPGG